MHLENLTQDFNKLFNLYNPTSLSSVIDLIILFF